MVPVGYLYNRVASRPGWLKAGGVADVDSLSGRISQHLSDYINYWKHNGYWLFDSPEVIEGIAKEEMGSRWGQACNVAIWEMFPIPLSSSI